MKSTLTLTLLLLASPLLADEYVHHPSPKEPLYLSSARYEGLKAKLSPPPTLESRAQKKDEEELFQLQKDRTLKDCERAKTEVKISVGSFYGSPFGPLSERDVKALTPFFDQLRNDGDFFIQKMKVQLPRKRPFLYLKEISPCVPKEVTGSYPSGHAFLSKLFALVLADLYPSLKETFELRAKQIGTDRILSGQHHRSDVEAGRKLAELIFEEMKKSPRFNSDLEAIRTGLKN